MKSVTIRDCNGQILIKVLHGKKCYDVKAANDIADKIDIEIRDDQNRKVYLQKNKLHT